MKVYRFFLFLCAMAIAVAMEASPKKVWIETPQKPHARVEFGLQRLSQSLARAGYQTAVVGQGVKHKSGTVVKVLLKGGASSSATHDRTADEGFSIVTKGNQITIEATSPSGILYGCLELSQRVNELGALPKALNVADKPEMVLRGACVGLQKTVYLPGHDVYEYPYTPENFPWFYDKQLWVRYLDMLVENRMNSLYLWNGHPFASLVKLDDYPYALEVDNATFAKNEEMFRFLTEEADKRGIFVIQMFYNIIVSKPFAEHHGIKTQDRSRPITPLLSDYTRKSIGAFIEKYPNVGLLVCLGEAMDTYEDDVEWFTKTIIPGVKDGLAKLGQTDLPPLLLRAHDTNCKMVMDAALPLYGNLYTMHKYNGESLTTYQPRGPWTKIHQDLSALGSVHISNVHILANLEPFRYASPNFIQKSVQAMHRTHGANGLHLYPQTSYWDWPYTADKVDGRLLQIDRDWMWYQTWARYAWKAERDSLAERDYWSRQLGQFFGCKKQDASLVLEAYDQMGEIAPKLLRRFGITDGNRQTLTLGMFMSQLVNPTKWRIYPEFYESNGPKGEILIEYALKEAKGLPHVGETPPQIIDQVVQHADKAVAAIDAAQGGVTANRDEFVRLRNDVHCYQALAHFFDQKVKAAMWVLKFNYSKNIADLEQALPYLKKSVEHYTKLVELTNNTYLYANSMQTGQRRIPIGGNDGTNKHWNELLPRYQEELDNFARNIHLLKTAGQAAAAKTGAPLTPVDVEVLSGDEGLYPLTVGTEVYKGQKFSVADLAPELARLKGVRFDYDKQLQQGTTLVFRNTKPVKVVVGYFNGSSIRLLNPPTLETNASANDRGQAEIRLANAMDVNGLFPVNVYTYYFEAGCNELKLGKGLALVLGFMDGNQPVHMRDAGIGASDDAVTVDWLFY